MTQMVPAAEARHRIQTLVESERFQHNLARMLPKVITPERFAAVALGSLSRNPGLLQCTPQSVALCMLQAAAVGLEVDSGLGHAYLVPFRDRKAGTSVCTLILGYRGLVQLLYRSAAVASVEAHVVREGDAFQYRLGLNPQLEHEPVGDPTAPVTHAYAIIRNKDGSATFDVMSHAEIEAVRARSRASASGPWVTDYAAMAAKTVLRRLAKLAPMSVEDQRAVVADERADANLGQIEAFAPEVTGALAEGAENGIEPEAGESLAPLQGDVSGADGPVHPAAPSRAAQGVLDGTADDGAADAEGEGW